MIIEEANRLAFVKEYYFARKLREIRALNTQGHDIINLGIGNPDRMPSDETIKELIQQVAQPGVHGYQPYKGIPALRQGFSDWYHNSYGVMADPESEVLPLIGSKEGIMHISMAFLNEGDEVLIPNPGYPTYRSVARLVGASIREYQLSADQDWFPDLKVLAQQDLSKVKIMWINYPHMPTGAVASAEALASLVEFARVHQILLCHDNPYSLVLNPDPRSILSIPGAKEVAIELNSLSKSHNMAGWRIGMIAGAADYVTTILKVKSNMDSGMFYPLQKAAVKALENGYAWHQHRNETYAYRRNIVWRLLETLGCRFEKDQAGMFVWAKIPDHEVSGEAFSDKILEQTRVFLTPGFIFGEQGDRYIRASLCASKERLQDALGRLLENQLTNV
ncbi:MAG: aminotransferase class I/II-fold pyridoxal phosphate-dependent enzyme [Bacteroidota bacterium]